MDSRFSDRYQTSNCYGYENLVYHRWCSLDISNEFSIQEAGVTLPHKDYYVKRLESEINIPNLYTLEYVCSGSGYIETEKERFHVKKGDTYLLRWKEEFVYYADPDEPFEKMWINFSGKVIRGVLTLHSMDQTVNVVHVDTSEAFSAIYRTLNNINQVGYGTAYLRVLHNILDIFEMMSASYIQGQSKQQKLARLIKDHIDNSSYYDITVTKIVEITHYCERHLERAFKQCYGMSIKRYIQNCKVKQAKQMIRYSGLTLSQIGEMLGFGNYKHFSYVFRMVMGETPAQFAKRERINY